MKNLKIILSFVLLISLSSTYSAFGQWNSSGSHVYYNNGNVGIGTSAPSQKLEVNGAILSKYLYLRNSLGGWQFTTTGGGKDLLLRSDPNNGTVETRMYLKQNGNIGIGTSAPQSKLHIASPNYARLTMTATYPGSDVEMFIDARGSEGNERGQFGTLSNHDMRFYTNSQPRMIVHKNGRIGINTSSGLDAQLNVRSTDMQLQLVNSNSGGATWNIGASSNNWAVGGGKFVISKPGSSTGAALVINSNNSVGIGTTTPNSAYRLSVNGKIRAKEIVVEAGWADFVFEQDYQLMPLEEVEAYILTHKHLPEIPSAKEVEENGISVGEMESKLLQKVEELTLYLIELKKENAALSQLVQQLDGIPLQN